MRRSSLFLLLTALELLLLGLFAAHASIRRQASGEALARAAQAVSHLQLTDLAVFTEARYARHLTQADLSSAFQDHPLALDHFPAGSLVSPPALVRAGR